MAAALIFIAIGLFFYFLPSIVGRKKRNAGAIVALNLLLGWTILGWILALVWAMTTDPPNMVPVIQVAQPVAQPLAQPTLCANCGKYSVPGSQFCTSCGGRFALTAKAGSGTL